MLFVRSVANAAWVFQTGRESSRSTFEASMLKLTADDLGRYFVEGMSALTSARGPLRMRKTVERKE
jgi:hypothetical protein